MTVLRILVLGLVTCLMTLTGIGAANARGQMAADGVICGSGTFVVVLAADGLPLFDADGDPVEAQQLPCLDCVFSGLAPLAPGAAPTCLQGASSVLSPPPERAISAGLWRMGGLGRGPPDRV